MLSVRWGERALPLAWRVEEPRAPSASPRTELLAVVAGWLPADLGVVLLADRFYGTPAMIRWCHDRGWDYRLRLRASPRPLGHNKPRRRLAWPAATSKLSPSPPAGTTNIGIIRDPGHAEPWIIAMSAKPGYLTTWIC